MSESSRVQSTFFYVGVKSKLFGTKKCLLHEIPVVFKELWDSMGQTANYYDMKLDQTQ